MKTLNHFDISAFLRDYWQKRPLLIRNALSSALFSLTPEELAGLACEEDVESRLIKGTLNDGFQLQHGPFAEAIFTQLPEENWTLLVQAVDHFLPQVADLLDYFRFIPNWRIDDIMVSYAKQGGSAGPHYDNYDVFLIQGAGTRLWQVGDSVDISHSIPAHEDLRLLSNFKATDEWELQPGDILYLPPRYTHWGIATDSDCMTYSIGFRSPSIAELVSDYCDFTIARLDPEWHYQDPELTLQDNPGEISPAVIKTVQQLILEQLSDNQAFQQWFGTHVTQPKYPNDTGMSESVFPEFLQTALQQHKRVYRNPACRFAYTSHDKSVDLFINGEHFPLPSSQQDCVQLLCGQTTLESKQLQPYLQDSQIAPILLALFAQDSLYFEDDLFD